VTDKFGPGQADKAAAERRTAEVGAENARAQEQAASQEQARRRAAYKSPQESVDPQLVKRGADGDSAAERVMAAEDLTGDAPEVVDPYPAYEARSVEELRSLASSRKVEINRDVEKAHLVYLLRQKDPTPAWDLMPLEDLRGQASEQDVELDPEWEQAHLITELRAADTHTG
jgi:hypothetical protein